MIVMYVSLFQCMIMVCGFTALVYDCGKGFTLSVYEKTIIVVCGFTVSVNDYIVQFQFQCIIVVCTLTVSVYYYACCTVSLFQSMIVVCTFTVSVERRAAQNVRLAVKGLLLMLLAHQSAKTALKV